MKSILSSAITAVVMTAAVAGLWFLIRPRSRTRLRVGSTALCPLVTQRAYEADDTTGGPRPMTIFERWSCGLHEGHGGVCQPVIVITGAEGEPVVVRPRA